MTIQYLAANHIIGLSSDTKPTTVPTNSTFFETDTKLMFIFNGTSWGQGHYQKFRTLYVAADGSGDYSSIGAAFTYLNSRSTTERFIVEVSPDDYSESTGVAPTRGNFWLKGAGFGNTKWIGTTSLPDATPIFDVRPSNSNAGDTLSVNATIGAKQVTITPVGNAANYANGDYVLIKSSLVIDDELGSRFQGELHKVVGTPNPATGVIPLDTTIYETFTTANTSKIAKLSNFYSNIMLSGISFSSLKTSVSNSLFKAQGANFYYCKNVHVFDCEFGNLYYNGLEIGQTLGARVNNNYFHDIFDVTPANNSYYGIDLRGAAINMLVENNDFEFMRHGISYDANGGTNLEGRGRNIVINANSFRNTTTSHIDCHQGCDGIVISNNVCIGDDGAANAIQARSPALVTGNFIKSALGRAIYLFYTSAGGSLGGASKSIVTNNRILDSTNGVLVDLNVHNVVIEGNEILGCTDYAITNIASASAHGGDNSSISRNYIKDGTFNYIIGWNSAADAKINDNWLSGTATPRGIRLQATHQTPTNYQILNNKLVGAMGSPSLELVGTTHQVYNNMGYNPQGVISNPFPTSGAGNITNLAQAAAVPASTTVQTVAISPKAIQITGGTLTNISVNGTTVATAAGNYYFKLDVSETIAITYSVAPTIKVTAL